MTQCFRKGPAGIGDKTGYDVVCPGTRNSARHSSCCFHGDECLSNVICHFTHFSEGGSGYYTQDCTDPTYEDTSVCPQVCTNQNLPDIVYSYRAQLWLCCGIDSNGTVTCGGPTSESFSAPPPEQLVAANSTLRSTSVSSLSPSILASTGIVTSTQIQTSSLPSKSPLPSPDTDVSPKSGLSSGATAGIGVGTTIVVSLAFASIFVLWRKRQKRQVRLKDTSGLYETRELPYQNLRHEKGADGIIREYNAERPAPSERPAHTNAY